jgi:hypothetical protein
MRARSSGRPGKLCSQQYDKAEGHASERLRASHGMVFTAVKRDWHAFGFASEKLRTSVDIVLLAKLGKHKEIVADTKEKMQYAE